MTTIQSVTNPTGLPRNMLAWLNNATVRGGGISNRRGMFPLCTVHPGNVLYQGGYMYQPNNPFGQEGYPELILSIAGTLYKVNVGSDNSVQALTGQVNPTTTQQSFFAQGNQFLVVQAGDGVTLPLFYDGTNVRRSNGLPGSELPAAGPMDYFMGRMWYGNGRLIAAGDITGDSASGTPTYNFTDAILKVTENPFIVGGDGFEVPGNDGEIRCIRHTSELDVALGQGNLYIGTRKAIYRLQVPVTRTDWIAATANNQPLMTVSQSRFGIIGDRAAFPHNADMFYKAVDGTRSLMLSVRYFNQWGNTPISRNIRRVTDTNDKALMKYTSGVEFDNRILFLEQPHMTEVGAAFKAISVLDLDLISTLEEKRPPAWEGIYEGLDILQILEGDFGGLQRCFCVARSVADGSIQVWELSSQIDIDDIDHRIAWSIETPAFVWDSEFKLKTVEGAELWMDRITGFVDLRAEYRVDGDSCWRFWHEWQCCAQQEPVPYVSRNVLGKTFRAVQTLPKPPDSCENFTGRPANVGYQFQVRLSIKGSCRIRGLLLYGYPTQKTHGAGMVC
ncbi:MAG TPA: hypothetical protein VF077_12975 [Nitrospiraceae bacterium]